MYVVINKTTGKNLNYTGSFPYNEIIELLEQGDDIIIVSTYSNTVKIPYLDTNTNNYGETKSSHNWCFREHFLPLC